MRYSSMRRAARGRPATCWTYPGRSIRLIYVTNFAPSGPFIREIQPTLSEVGTIQTVDTGVGERQGM